MNEFFKVAIDRIKSDSPIFFIKIRKFCVWFCGVCGTMLITYTKISHFGLTIPPNIIDVMGTIVWIGTGTGLTTFLTTKHPEGTDDGLKDPQ